MKILRNLLVIFLALALISGRDQEADDRLAEASENVRHSCDHSACEQEIAILEAELDAARKSCLLELRIEIEFVPGLLGDWARLEFQCDPIEISAQAAQSLCVGDDLCQKLDSDWNIIACRIIVEDLIPSA